MSWLVEEGAQITVGMPILEVESDKIANAVERPTPGCCGAAWRLRAICCRSRHCSA